MREKRNITYAEYAEDAQDGDVALWRPTHRWGWSSYIARATGGPYSHVTGIVFWSEVDRWMSCGYEEGKGGFAEPLDVTCSRHPGRIDIHRVKPQFVGDARKCVARRLGQDLGYRYGWWSIWRIVAPALPLMGLFTPEQQHRENVANAAQTSRGAICSEHIHRSFLACGVELVRTESGTVTPNDLGRSVVMDYVGTLIG